MADAARPNILWIIADQLRADHVGFGGNAIVRTPNLDALAARGTVFDRAYVANPICMPNRCSMLTGRMPSAHGVIFNDRSLSWGANTFVRRLAAVGYRTALIGKSHIQHGLSRNVVRAQAEAATLEDAYPQGWDSLENPERYLDGTPAIDDFYGFRHVEFAIGHGDAVAGHHYRWALERGATPAQLRASWGTEGSALERYPDWWQVYQPTLPEELYSTTFVTERTLARIEAAATDDAPFFIQCSFPDPHHPFTPPGRWWRAYDPREMPIPRTFADPLVDAPAHLQLIRSFAPRRDPVRMFGPTEGMVRHAMAAEFGMIEMMDSGIGRILDRLGALGLADDTIVVFTSDHGDMFGDHGLMLKATMHYEGCIRIPLVIARPGDAGRRSSALACSLDLARTFLDLAGASPFVDMQGVSLTSLLDRDAPLRSHVYIEEDMPLARHGSPLPLRSRTLVTDRYRYSRYSSGDVEIYDLDTDPDELVNLAVRAEHAALRSDLAERMLDAAIAATPIPTIESHSADRSATR